MKKILTVVIEIESNYPEELEENYLKEAISTELFDVPRTGKIVSIETQLISDFIALMNERAPVKDKKSNRRPAYICDPAKNTSCTKEGCMIFHFCRCTTNKEFAKTGENNKPIVALRSDMEDTTL